MNKRMISKYAAMVFIASTALLAGCMGDDTYRKSLLIKETYPESEIAQVEFYDSDVTFLVRKKNGEIRVVEFRKQDDNPTNDELVFPAF